MEEKDTKIELTYSWKWTPDTVICSVKNIKGGTVSDGIKRQITNLKLNLSTESKAWKSGESLNNYLHTILPKPEGCDLGTVGSIEAWIGDTSVIEVDEDIIKILYWVEYSNEKKERVWHELSKKDLLEMTDHLLREISIEVDDNMQQYFLTEYGSGEINPDKWKANKKKIFISYRSNTREIVEKLATDLGEYGNQSFFIPSTDYLDLQAGNWLEQLKSLIQDCDIFIPILTEDYLNGPITKPELDLALRQNFENTDKKIIPILIDGKVEEYKDTWLGGFHIVKTSGDIDSSKLEEVVSLVLGVSNNPYRK